MIQNDGTQISLDPQLPTSYELIHYSSKKVANIDLSRTYQQPPSNLFYHTPNGLWLSVAGINDWKQYCGTKYNASDKLKSEFQIIPKPDAKVLIIYNNESFEIFEKEYCYYPEGIAKQGANFTLNISVSWDRIINEYQGMIVATFLPKYKDMGLRLGIWSCTSGCIWDLQAVDKAVKLK
jgi:hypothetical protein